MVPNPGAGGLTSEMNMAELETHDQEFEGHPLSRVRLVLKQVKNSLNVAADVAAQPVFEIAESKEF